MIHSNTTSSGLGESVRLQNISGKSVTLPYPTTYKAILDAAVAPPFSLVPETVKIHANGRLVHVASYLKQHSRQKDGGALDASAYTVAPRGATSSFFSTASSAPSAGVPHATPASAPPESSSGGGSSTTLSPTHPSLSGRRGSLVRSLIVYGVPRRAKGVRGDPAAAAADATHDAKSCTTNAVSASSSDPSAATAASREGTRTALSGPSAQSHPPPASDAARASVKPPAATKRTTAQAREPLPYPHSPDGLLELAAAVTEAESASYEEEDGFIDIFRGAPRRVYNHPTMSFIANKVKGNLVTLRAVMEQIYRVSPVFYDWVEKNPSKFLSALNRRGEQSMQQVREQLRLLAIEAITGQASVDGSGRRVMMLEINNRDGSPDLYQVEVQVGGFSDDDEDEEDEGDEELEETDEEEEDEEEEDVSLTSVMESMLGAYMEHERTGDALKEKAESDEEDGEEESEEATGGEDVDVDVSTDDEDGRHPHRQYRAAHATTTTVDASTGEGAEEPHRGAILLPPPPATAAVTPANTTTTAHVPASACVAGQRVAASASQPALTASPTPPSGTAPARAWRPSPTSSVNRSLAAAAVSPAMGASSAESVGLAGASPATPTPSSTVATSATSPTPAEIATTTGLPALAAGTQGEDAEKNNNSNNRLGKPPKSQEEREDDARLVRLRAASQAVVELCEAYARQGDDAAARRAHEAIMALRPQYFATAREVCGSLSTPTSTSTAAGAGMFEAAQDQARLLRRLVRCACEFFVSAEEFYAQLEEEGVRSSVFGPSPTESLPAWAAVAALSRLLLCDVDAVAQAAVARSAPAFRATHNNNNTVSSQSSTTNETGSDNTASASTPGAESSGPRRVGALRALHADNSLWSSPALQWALTRSPEELLQALLQLCRQQRAVLVWYSCHYLMKPVGKTIQTMAYVLGGTEEAQQAVALQRLKMTSRAHKADEVADFLRDVAGGSVSTTNGNGRRGSSGAHRQWMTLMRARYQQLVRPLEGDLPTPHMTSNTLYICDTRHVLPPKEPAGEHHHSQASADAATAVAAVSAVDGQGGSDSAARWWGGYCDDRFTMCADKWCLAATLRPWSAVAAAANAQGNGSVEKAAVCLVASRAQGSGRASGAGSVGEKGVSSVPFLAPLLPAESIAVMDGAPTSSAASAASLSAPSARHTVVLYEETPAPAASAFAGEASAVSREKPSSTSAQGLCPHFIGDIHVVDVAPTDHVGDGLVTRLAGGAALPTQLTTVARNFALPSSVARKHERSLFLRLFFEMLAHHPQIPAAAAARHAALANATANGAPWLVCEYVLLDYGGAIRSLTTATAAAAATAHATPSAPAARNAATSHASPLNAADAISEDFVRMPCVPLGRRLSEPRPVSAVSRSRSASQSDTEARSTTARATALGASAGATASAPFDSTLHASPSSAAAAAAEADALKRQYARTHAIDELYEMMLGSLLEQQPTGEQNVLDHLVNFLETSEGAMQEKVHRRQAEMAAGAVAASAAATATAVEATASGSKVGGTATVAAVPGAFTAPQPPTTKRNSKGRPSFSRRKSSS